MHRFPLVLSVLAIGVLPAVAAGQTGQTPGPGQTPGAGQTPRPGQTPGAGQTGASPGADPAALPKQFYGRSFEFAAEAAGYDSGELAITIHKIAGLPSSLKVAVNAAIDEADAIALCGRLCKVVNGRGRTLRNGALARADRVVVKGKMLPAASWHSDEDGNPVPTIRAKRVTILR
jgi:hypothetical protein